MDLRSRKLYGLEKLHNEELGEVFFYFLFLVFLNVVRVPKSKKEMAGACGMCGEEKKCLQGLEICRHRWKAKITWILKK